MLMKLRIVAAVSALVAVLGIGILNAPAADAYAYWRGGYFYADTGYARNVPTVYVKVIGHRDVARQVYHLRVWLYDTKTDGNRAAVRVRGWDKQTNKFVLESSLSLTSTAKGSTYGTMDLGTSVVDTLILQDCILGRTCGSNSVAIFRRYPS